MYNSIFCTAVLCHSDLHQVRNQWQNAMPTTYPCVPGHEIVGRVVKTGSAVKKFKEGDIAAVGCMVDSCRTCASCRAGEEQYCDSFPTLTYNGEDKSTLAASPMVAIPTASWWTRRLSCGFRTN